MTEELKAAKAAEAAEAADVKRLRVTLAKAYLCLAWNGKECLDGTMVYLRPDGMWKIAELNELAKIGYDIQVEADRILPHCDSFIMGFE